MQAAKYYSAIDNYIAYINTAARRGQRVGTGKARPPSITLYVEPFNLELGNEVQAKTSASATSWNTHEAKFSAYTKTTLAQDVIGLKPEGFSAARVIIVTGLETAGTVETSAVTGMKYKSYGGVSTSIPFGKHNATANQMDVFNSIKGSFGTLPATSRITLKPEKV